MLARLCLFLSFVASQEVGPCHQALRESSQGLIGGYVPQCDDAGAFHRVQCHGSTGMCWCADPTTGAAVSERSRGAINGPEDCEAEAAAPLEEEPENPTATHLLPMMPGPVMTPWLTGGAALGHHHHTRPIWLVDPTAEQPAGIRNMGSYTRKFFTPEQQQRLGVDEDGKPVGSAPEMVGVRKMLGQDGHGIRLPVSQPVADTVAKGLMLGLAHAMQHRRQLQQPQQRQRQVVIIRSGAPRGHVFGRIMGVLNRMRERLHRVRDESLKKQSGQGKGPDFAQLGSEASADHRKFEFESKADALRQMALKILGDTPWWRAGVAKKKFHSRLETKVVVHHEKYYKDDAGCWHKGKYGVWCQKEGGSWFQKEQGSGAGEEQKKSQFSKRFEKLIKKGFKAISKNSADDFLGKKKKKNGEENEAAEEAEQHKAEWSGDKNEQQRVEEVHGEEHKHGGPAWHQHNGKWHKHKDGRQSHHHHHHGEEGEEQKGEWHQHGGKWHKHEHGHHGHHGHHHGKGFFSSAWERATGWFKGIFGGHKGDHHGHHHRHDDKPRHLHGRAMHHIQQQVHEL